MPGTILYQNGDGIFTMGGKPVHFGQLPVDQTEPYFVFGLSPDGKWLAYSHDENNTPEDLDKTPFVELLSATGERKKYPLDVSAFESQLVNGSRFAGFSNSEWINNALIATTLVASQPRDTNLSIYINSPKIFNAFSGEARDDFFDLPNRQPLISYNTTQNYGISPDENRVLYERAGGNRTDIALWDVKKRNILWSSALTLGGFSQIRWTSDSRIVAYSNGMVDPADHKVFTLSSDGKENKLVFDITLGAVIQDMIWSPDGRYLVMTGIGISKKNSYELFLYDRQEQRYRFRCMLFSAETEPLPDLVWSPESTFIAYTTQENVIQLFNIATGEIKNTEINGKVVGWSAQIPVK
jgi:WD40 repeat protein